MQEPKILSSDFRRKMKINENGEKLVDLRIKCPNIYFEIGEYLNADNKHPSEVEDAYFVRESVANLINKAQNSLPSGFKIVLRCGYRNQKVQARGYRKGYKELKKKNPHWDEKKLRVEIEKRVDPADVGPHCSGGAIDITIADKQGHQLDMGTKIGDFSKKAYTYTEKITKEQRLNRQILINAMLKINFFDFPTEWWHWSYGEREWAYDNNKTAFYGPIKARR